MNAFVQQLHHRKVGRAFGLYLVAAATSLVLAGLLFPKLNLPNWSLPALLILMLASLPVVLGYAWYFNFTGRKLTRTFAPGLPGPASALPVIVAGIILSTATGIFTVPRAHNFMATAKTPPTEFEVSKKVKEVLNRFAHYPGGAQNIPGAAKLRGPAGPHETSLGLDPLTERQVITSLNGYIREFQPGHRIEEDEYGEKKNVVELTDLVCAKMKPEPPKPPPPQPGPSKPGKGG